MKNDRLGDWLWEEWDGFGHDPVKNSPNAVYFTYEWVDVSNDIVKRALASCLQRDGIAHSLGDGFAMAESAIVSNTYAGYIDGDKFMTLCNDYGETEYGDLVDTARMITVVEL